ncbi:hypothetical protein N657DRAFT_642956 [Parathielavia appendiculata]|uniref:Uncharacterized protein n=1 Tax=Parathielavia appendiculata TaxID=2587402 RepID=A0AAN6U564_9PEZI|nr:hypothetical protein N657DRAFT_642956 [Parathielavia appendiculata]
MIFNCRIHTAGLAGCGCSLAVESSGMALFSPHEARARPQAGISRLARQRGNRPRKIRGGSAPGEGRKPHHKGSVLDRRLSGAKADKKPQEGTCAPAISSRISDDESF